MASVIERLNKGIANCNAYPTPNIYWPIADLEKLLAAFEARGELITALDDYYGVGLVRGQWTPEVERITRARKAADAALRDLEGE